MVILEKDKTFIKQGLTMICCMAC